MDNILQNWPLCPSSGNYFFKEIFRKIKYKNLLFSSLLLRQQTSAAAGAVPKQLNNKNVIVCTFCAKNMATKGIFGKYIIKKMEKQARKVSFWVNEPFETKGFETPVKSVDRLLALAFEVIARNITVFFENPGFCPHSIWILPAEIQIYSDDQCAAVKSFWKKKSQKNVLNLKKKYVKTLWWRQPENESYKGEVFDRGFDRGLEF